MGSFQHRQSRYFDHPHLRLTRRGRPTVLTLCQAAEVVSRPFVDYFLKEFRQRLQPAMAEGEYVFANHVLTLQRHGSPLEHYLEICMTHDSPGKRVSGPVAHVDLLSRRIVWVRVTDGRLCFQEIAGKPEEFRATFEEAIRGMFGF